MSSSVSIVIATFNDAKNLTATLESVRQQSGINESDVQVIVSDGGSADDTPAVLAAYADVITNVDSRPDAGVYDGMNIGAGMATGEWLHFLNAGDTFTGPNCLSTWREAVDSDPVGHAWVISRAINLRSHSGPPVSIPSVPHSWWRHALGWQPHCHQATWFRRSVFEAMGGYTLDRGFAGDFDLILRFGLVSRPLEIPTPLISYLGGGMSEVGRAQIPGLQHTIRTDRLNLGRAAAALDFGVAKAVGKVNRLRGQVGAARIRWKHAHRSTSRK